MPTAFQKLQQMRKDIPQSLGGTKGVIRQNLPITPRTPKPKMIPVRNAIKRRLSK